MKTSRWKKIYTKFFRVILRLWQYSRRRSCVLEQFTIDGVELQIIDFWYWPNRKVAIRSLRTTAAVYSSISLWPRQPMILMSYFQGITELLKVPGDESYRRSLVLGGAGGSVVHYLLDFFPRCHVDGIELNPQLIDIAKRYFLMGWIYRG